MSKFQKIWTLAASIIGAVLLAFQLAQAFTGNRTLVTGLLILISLMAIGAGMWSYAFAPSSVPGLLTQSQSVARMVLIIILAAIVLSAIFILSILKIVPDCCGLVSTTTLAPTVTYTSSSTYTPFPTSTQTITPTDVPTPTLTPSLTPTATAFPDLTSEDIRKILGLGPTTTIYKAPDGFFISCYDGSFKAGTNANVLPDGSVTLNNQPTYSLQEIINAMVFNWPGNYKAFFFVKAELLDSLPRNVVIYAKGQGGFPEYRNMGPDEFKQLIINKAFPTGIDDLRIQYVK